MVNLRTVLTLLVLVALPVGLHLPTLDADFHLDDAVRILDNPGVEQLHPLGRHFVDPTTNANLPRLRQYRPLLPLSLALDHARAGGHDPASYRQTNLALHVLITLLLWRLLAGLLRDAGGRSPGEASSLGALAALLYGVHPVAGVPVLYLCARDLLFMQLLWLTALLAWTRMRWRRGDSALGWGLTLLALALSLLGKTNAVFAPALVLAFELLVDPDRRTGRSARPAWARLAPWLRALPFVALVLGFFAWTRWGLDFSDVDILAVDHGSAWTYPLTQLRVHLCVYLRNAVAPFWLRPLPDVAWVDGQAPWASLTEPGVWLGALVVLGSLTWALRARRRAPLAAFAVFAYWISLAPTSSLMAFRYAATDYRQVPGLPWLLLLLVLAGQRLLPRVARPLSAALVVLGLSLAALSANAPWQTDLALWTDAVAKGSTSNGQYNLARQLMAEDPPRARELLEDIVDAEPGFIVAQISLALLEIRAGEVDAGLQRVRRAVQLEPTRPDSQLWYTRALREAAAQYAAAGRSGPAGDAAFEAWQRTADGSLDELLVAARQASLAGDDAATLERLALLHARRPEGLGDSRFLEAWARQRPTTQEGVDPAGVPAALERAVSAYDAHLQAHADDAQAHFNRAHALLQLGRAREALRGFERCRELHPAQPDIDVWIATARARAEA